MDSRIVQVAIVALACQTALAGEGRGKEYIARIDAALGRAGRSLMDRQSSDGAWRSAMYAVLGDGPSLTPYVLSSLFFLPQAGPDAPRAYRRGIDYLVGMMREDGEIDTAGRPLMFPVYTAAMAARSVVLEDRSRRTERAQHAWLALLSGYQLDERLGWQPADPEYGGWGYSIQPPRRAREGESQGFLVESNLSATLFALAALRSARVPASDPAYAKALRFVTRCQNYPEDTSRVDPRFDDGGFFFMPDDVAQNKAGPAGTDRLGRLRFRSYGTMTADGLRALLACGLPADDARVAAASRWLNRHFSAAENPGCFDADRTVLQNATYYYWAWSAAHALSALEIQEIDTPRGRVRWAESLADEMLRRQEPDGTWVNPFTDAKEDDPLVATPWAASALAICRAVITNSCPTLAGTRQALRPRSR